MFANNEYPKQKIVRTPEQGGTTCDAGVSGWRFKTPSGRTEDGLPSKGIPLINIPPIVYSNQSRDQTSNQETNDVPSSSSFDTFMKSFRTSLVSPSVDKPKVSFVKNNQGEFMAVPYDSTQNADFVEITGKPGEEASRFYNKKTKKSRDGDDNSDNEDETKEENPVTKDNDDYIFHMYVGSLSVIGLLILFRIIQKS